MAGMQRLTVGLVLNPIAGLGGPAGLKGTDGVVDEALRRGSQPRAQGRAHEALRDLDKEFFSWKTLPGEMGESLLEGLGLPHDVVGRDQIAIRQTSARDTRLGVELLEAAGVDLLVFAGGDGTARDVVDARDRVPVVLGIPSGVKMHSGVFATSPNAACELLAKIAAGEILSIVQAEVRDIDEASFREGIVKTRYHGELPVPDDLRYMQQTKIGGREVEELVIEEIAADFIERQEPGVTYVMGSGATLAGIMAAMGLEATLLGIDVVRDGELIASDVSEQQLLALLPEGIKAKILVTAIGGQGHILGRGNQQLSPTVIRRVGAASVEVVATKSKLAELDKRPLLVDTGDEVVDASLRGLRSVITGYEDRVLYRVA